MNWRAVGIVILSLLIGFAADAGATYWFATTPQGQKVIRDFLVKQTTLAAQREGVATPEVSLASSTPPTLPVPKTYASESYYLAVNNVLRDIFEIDKVNNELGPILEKLNTATITCTFERFYDLMGAARALANRNDALVAQFGVHLNSLQSANTATTDALTKTQTNTLVESGRTLHGALKTYAQALQELLYGGTPTSAQIEDFQQKVIATTGASQNFSDSFKPLFEHMLQELKRIVATSTPER